ncbi:MAG: acyltransferase [Candidatus Peribacteraceae bacterium]|nr:acyltransferase [Candidatus Peribacteraceae bacterium]
MAQRDLRLDLLKCLALACIAVAHLNPPAWLQQLGNFNVILLVLVAGAGYRLSESGRTRSYWEYLRRRVPRLIVPVWIYFAAYFGGLWLVTWLAERPFPVSWKKVLGAFLLLDTIGYSWILRILALVAIAAPLLPALRKRLENERQYLLAALTLLLTACVVVHLFPSLRNGLPGYPPFLTWRLLVEIFPYFGVFALGTCLPLLDRRRARLLGGCFLLAWIYLFCWHQNWAWVTSVGAIRWNDGFKYPPEPYYLTYGLGVSFLFWSALPVPLRLGERLERAVTFVGRHSLSFYLWHVAWLSPLGMGSWRGHPLIVQFVLLTALVTGCVALQTLLVDGFRQRRRTKNDDRVNID